MQPAATAAVRPTARLPAAAPRVHLQGLATRTTVHEHGRAAARALPAAARVVRLPAARPALLATRLPAGRPALAAATAGLLPAARPTALARGPALAAVAGLLLAAARAAAVGAALAATRGRLPLRTAATTSHGWIPFLVALTSRATLPTDLRASGFPALATLLRPVGGQRRGHPPLALCLLATGTTAMLGDAAYLGATTDAKPLSAFASTVHVHDGHTSPPVLASPTTRRST